MKNYQNVKLPKQARLGSLKTREKTEMIDITALTIEIFGVGSLSLAFAKYTLMRRKLEHAKN